MLLFDLFLHEVKREWIFCFNVVNLLPFTSFCHMLITWCCFWSAKNLIAKLPQAGALEELIIVENRHHDIFIDWSTHEDIFGSPERWVDLNNSDFRYVVYSRNIMSKGNLKWKYKICLNFFIEHKVAWVKKYFFDRRANRENFYHFFEKLIWDDKSSSFFLLCFEY